MKQFLFIPTCLLFLFNSCSKKINTILPPQENAFVNAVFTYLNTHLAQEELQQLIPEQYTRLQRGDADQLLVINYRKENKFLVVEKLADGFASYINEMQFTDAAKQTGTLICNAINTADKSEIEFINGRVTSLHRYYNGALHPFATVANNGILEREGISIKPLPTEPVYAELPSVTFTGPGGYDNSITYISLYYMVNLSDLYYYSYTGGGGYIDRANIGGAVNSPAKNINKIVDIPMHAPGTKPVNINKELECFVTINGATYILRINVNQPEPNTRTVMALSADLEVGHTFITLEQKNPDGTSIIRNVGWYPESLTKPADGLKNGMYQDDSGTPYSVSLSIAVSAAEFNNAKNYLMGVKQYGVNDANCTTVGINAFAKAGVNLPQTKGVIYPPSNSYAGSTAGRTPLFQGVNPGDLGQDIRNLNATTLSQQRGGRMVVIEKNNTNNKSRSKSGKCS